MYDIGWAVTALNDEKRVRRAAWDTDVKYITKTGGELYMVMDSGGGEVPIRWTPTQEDVITPDWGFA